MSDKRILVPLAQGCEELEAVTIIDLMVRAGVEVVTASLDHHKVITASRGVQLIAKVCLEDVLDQRFDMVVLPGGLPGADHLNEDARIHRLLQKTVSEGGVSAAICAAPKVLATAGLLDDKRVTSFPGQVDATSAKGMTYLEDSVVVDGQIVTSRGPGTAMDFTLTLIELLMGAEKRQQVESGLMRPTH
ncbi:MAG: DJ-1/PfpI family protein [Hydrogenovibrio sp.]|nr:DJ-1/PfpI family protein [Hydrogenovibrio sp.]